MKFVGRPLTKEEAEKVLNPYMENDGEEFTLESVTKYIELGAEELEKDTQALKAIEDGLKKLGE